MNQSAYQSVIRRSCEHCGAEMSLHLVSLTPPIWKGKCPSCGQRGTAQDVPKVIGYLGVGRPQDQNLEQDQAEILAFARDRKLGQVNWVREEAAKAKTWNTRELGKVVATLNEGDWFLAPELARLGRSTLDILDCLATLKERGVKVHALKGASLLQGAIEPEVFRTMVDLCAEIESALVSARTREALKARRAAGVSLGRPKGPGRSKLDQYRTEIEALLQTGSTLKYIARRYGSSGANLINWLKKHKIDRTPHYGP
jgi:DNA invertase Pin-like site-specific DNA recombinase